MSSEPLPPELSNEWDDDDRPTRFAQRARLLKVIGLVALASLVLPGILVTWSTTRATAVAACQIAVDYYAPTAERASARFEVFPLEILGWTCHATLADGTELRVAHLGLIPGWPTLRPLTGT